MTPTDGFTQFLMSIPWFAWVAMVAIVCGSVTQLVAQCQRHFERMEMIRHGINPYEKGDGKAEKWREPEV